MLRERSDLLKITTVRSKKATEDPDFLTLDLCFNNNDVFPMGMLQN